MNQIAVIGALILAGLGVTGLTILIALDRPVEAYVTAFVTIAGFVTTILVTAKGMEKQNEKLETIQRNVNGNNTTLIRAALASSSLSNDEIERIISEQHKPVETDNV